MKNIMTEMEWRRQRRTKATLCIIGAVVGLIMMIIAFCQDGPAALFNGPIFLVGIGLLLIGGLGLLVLIDQTYNSYKNDALH